MSFVYTVTHLESPADSLPWRWTAQPTFCLRRIWRWNLWIRFFQQIHCRNLWSTRGTTCCRTIVNSRLPPGAHSSSMNWSISCFVCLDLSFNSFLSCRSIRSNRYVELKEFRIFIVSFLVKNRKNILFLLTPHIWFCHCVCRINQKHGRNSGSALRCCCLITFVSSYRSSAGRITLLSSSAFLMTGTPCLAGENTSRIYIMIEIKK